MASIKHLIFLIISLITFGYTFLVVGKFMFFLSAPRNVAKPYVWVFNLMDNDSRIKTALPLHEITNHQKFVPKIRKPSMFGKNYLYIDVIAMFTGWS
uniref:Uncharacterized protein n=1 Tax=Megaselia scalaris TaxID=36166 RepID=T1GRK5_MEGSC